MKISLNSAIILILAIAIFAGVLLYPARVNCTGILKDCEIKIKELDSEPNIRLAEPGEIPALGILGSSQGTGIDTKRSDLSQNYNRETRTTRSRYMQLLFFYLRNFSRSPFQGL